MRLLLSKRSVRIVVLFLTLSSVQGSIYGNSEGGRKSLIRPSKLTVGPSDSFDADLLTGSSALFFTQSQNMSSAIRKLDLQSGITTPVLSVDADSKSPRVSPDSRNIAFTYFRNDAKGDICYAPLSKVEPLCISKMNVTDESPVWISNTKIGYVSSEKQGEMAEFKVYDLESKQTTVLFQDSVVSPAVSKDLSTLLYVSRGSEIVFFDLKQSKSISRKNVGLTGLTGLVRFSEDGGTIYFTQYLVDSNRDLKIDVKDSGAIYRASYSNGDLNDRAEQLTSLDQSCSYPLPTSDVLFVTCAFEGSLDLYRVPLTGVIPSEWELVDLDLAHMSARSYADRLLLVNGMYVRDKNISKADYLSRSLINFYLLKEYRSVENLALLLSASSGLGDKETVTFMAKIAHARARWEALPGKRVTTAFQSFARAMIQGIEKESKADSIPAKVARAHLLQMLGESAKAATLLKSISDQKNSTVPSSSILLTYLYDELWLDLEPVKERRLQYLKAGILRNVDTPENQAYYLDIALNTASGFSDPLKSLSELLQDKTLPEKVRTVVANEIDLYGIAKAEDKKEWIRLGQEGTKRLQELGKDYHLKRLLMSRSVRFFSAHSKVEQLTNVSSLWLSYIRNTEMEFSYVLEVFRLNTTESAYQFLGDVKSKDKAKGAFFNNLRMSDNLEAHAMYSVLSPLPAEQEELRVQYNLMIADKLVRPLSLEFSQLVHRLVTSLDTMTVKDLEDGISLCEKLPDDQVGAGLKYHTIGFLHHRILNLTTEGFEYDPERSELAHKNYLLAIDLALGNVRLQASSFENLGVLHYSIRNYSLSADYFFKRIGYGFTTAPTEAALRWIFAKSLYRANRFKESLEQCEAGLKVYSGEQKSPWSEKCAFYALNAGEYKKADSYYASLFANAKQPEQLTAGSLLAHGFVLSKLGKVDEAQRTLTKAIESSEKEKKPSSDVKGAVPYQPLKTQWIAWGLLSQLKIPLDLRIKALKERIRLFGELLESPDSYQLSVADLYSDQLKELQILALLLAEKNDSAGADLVWNESIEKAVSYGEKLGFVSQPIQQTLKNFIYNSLWVRKYEAAEKAATEKLQKIVKSMASELKDNFRPSPIFVQLYVEANLLYEAYLIGRVSGGSGRFEGSATAVLSNPKVLEVLTGNPVLKTNVEKYRDAVGKSLL